jgi:DNA-directed RNA polymerase subunit RPC12/RpoP
MCPYCGSNNCTFGIVFAVCADCGREFTGGEEHDRPLSHVEDIISRGQIDLSLSGRQYELDCSGEKPSIKPI